MRPQIVCRQRVHRAERPFSAVTFVPFFLFLEFDFLKNVFYYQQRRVDYVSSAEFPTPTSLAFSARHFFCSQPFSRQKNPMGCFPYLLNLVKYILFTSMNHYAGPLEGRLFASSCPFVVLGWPSKSARTGFETKESLWSYLEAGSRSDPKAIFARAYEFVEGKWHRIPPLPTYLNRHETHTHLHSHDV